MLKSSLHHLPEYTSEYRVKSGVIAPLYLSCRKSTVNSNNNGFTDQPIDDRMVTARQDICEDAGLKVKINREIMEYEYINRREFKPWIW